MTSFDIIIERKAMHSREHRMAKNVTVTTTLHKRWIIRYMTGNGTDIKYLKVLRSLIPYKYEGKVPYFLCVSFGHARIRIRIVY